MWKKKARSLNKTSDRAAMIRVPNLSGLLVVAQAFDDVVKFLVGDEPATVQQLVLVDGFGQFLSLWFREFMRITKLPTLKSARGTTIVSDSTIGKRDGLLLK